MEMQFDKKSTDALERIASIVTEVISLVGDVVSSSDFQKKARLEFARRDVIRVASAQRQKMKDDAKAEIEKINCRAATERKTINYRAVAECKDINDRATAERKMVKDKLNAELKRFDDEVDAEIGKIDDILFGRRMGTVAKIAKIATPSVSDSCYLVGIPFEKPKDTF